MSCCAVRDWLLSDAADAESVEGTDFAVTGTVADEHRIADEMDGGVVVEAVGIAFDEFALRPGFAAVSGNGGDEGIALLRRKREHAGVIVVDAHRKSKLSTNLGVLSRESHPWVFAFVVYLCTPLIAVLLIYALVAKKM